MSEIKFDQAKHDELFQTARALAVTHNLLTQGIFSGQGYKDLNVAIPWVESFHKSVMEQLEPLMAAKEQSESTIPVVEQTETAVS